MVTLLDKGEYMVGAKVFPKMEVTKGNEAVLGLALYYSEVYGKQTNIRSNGVSRFQLREVDEETPYILLEEGELSVDKVIFGNLHSDFMTQVQYAMALECDISAYCSPSLLYKIKAFNQQEGRILELLPQSLPPKTFEEFCSENYLPQGMTPERLVGIVLGMDYKVLTHSRLCVQINEQVSLAYVPEVDTVVMIPTDLATRLSFDDFVNINFNGTYVCIGDIPIHTMLPGKRGIFIGGAFNLVQII